MKLFLAIGIINTFVLAEEPTMKEAPFGSWQSPISAEMVATGGMRFQSVKLANGKVYWLEGRPSEKGRTALMSWTLEEGEKELLPKGYNVRSRVHEYGGGALLIGKENIYFVEDKNQQIHALFPSGNVKQITSLGNARFADGNEHPLDGSLFYVIEQHDKTVENSIVRVDPKTGNMTSVASGYDFYASPRISPDGKSLAYISWNHPNLPWDGTELWVLNLESGEKRLIAGSKTESVCSPLWSQTGDLFYVSDRNGWWNLYREGKKDPLWAIDGELTPPQWVFDSPWIALTQDGIFCTYTQNAVNQFAKIFLEGKVEPISLPFTKVACLATEDHQIALIGASFDTPTSVVLYDTKHKKQTFIKKNQPKAPDPKYFSKPISLAFPSGDQTSYGFYYPPTNPNYRSLPNEKPPLLVMAHGGPTSHVGPSFNMTIFYWTSRGFAVLDVNYGGSTGYGRPYRERLNGNWGVVDVQDCAAAAKYAVEKGLADPKRLAIAGGSAGGYTTLAALAFRDVFHVGADYFGLSDLELFIKDTHKFELRYLDRLIGKYPEKKELYIERSPVHHIEKIRSPVIIFQGAEDAIVPPSQSELMYKSLLERKIKTAYFLFEGEQHGFRQAANIQKCLEEEYRFYSQVFGIDLKKR